VKVWGVGNSQNELVTEVSETFEALQDVSIFDNRIADRQKYNEAENDPPGTEKRANRYCHDDCALCVYLCLVCGSRQRLSRGDAKLQLHCCDAKGPRLSWLVAESVVDMNGAFQGETSHNI
jgi:hypothetical protein